MKYNKPEIAHVAPATDVIQMTSKINGTVPDNGFPLFTANAYEADE